VLTTTTVGRREHGLRHALDKAGVENLVSDSAAIREAARELRAMQREAREEWSRIRRAEGIAAYTDKRALSWVPIVVDQCYQTEEWRDILAAVRVVAKDPRSSPWAIREMCYRVAVERREREHAARKIAEREQGYGTGV